MAELDPGPSLYLGPNTPAEGGICRLFAALPDVIGSSFQVAGDAEAVL